MRCSTRPAQHCSQSGTAPEGKAFRTHNGLIAAFGQHLVKADILDAALGRALNRIQEVRIFADYSAEAPSLSDAESAVVQAEIFIAVIRDRCFARPGSRLP